jgi:hypothetical protein
MSQKTADRRAATLEYIHTMLGQLRNMAETEKCDLLAYLVELARVEAGEAMRRERSAKSRNGPPSPTPRRGA